MDDDLKRKAVVAGLGFAAFFAAVPLSRKLRSSFPEHPFVSQILVGGSLALAVYSIGKALVPESKAPEAMLSKALGVFSGTYNSMSLD